MRVAALKNQASILACRNFYRAKNIIFVVAGLFGNGAFGSSAEAGLFDQLFGGGEAGSVHQSLATPPQPHSHKERLDHSDMTPRKGAHLHLGRVETQLSYLPTRTRRRPHFPAGATMSSNGLADGLKRVNAELCYANGPRNEEVDQSDAILHNPTLRPGDSMMTAQGLRVFHGRSACPNKPSEFQSLADTRDLSSTKRGALSAIERAMKATHGRDLTNIVVRVDKPAAA